MTDVEQQLTALFHQRAAAAHPRPDVEAVLDDRLRPAPAFGPTPSGGRTLLRVAAVAIVMAGVIGIGIVRRHGNPDRSGSPTIAFPTEVPEAPPFAAGESPPDIASLSLTDGQVVLQMHPGAPSSPMFESSDAAGSASWLAEHGNVTDLDITGVVAWYAATCCSAGAELWRTGEPWGRAARLDVVGQGATQASVDPTTSTVGFGGHEQVIPGAVDVAVLDGYTAAVLISSSAPRLVVLHADAGSTALSRTEVPLPSFDGVACGLVALSGRVLIAIGTEVGAHAVDCVADRAIEVDSETGAVDRAIRLPAPVRMINSDHRDSVVAVTVDGALVVGDLAYVPTWHIIPTTTALAAALPVEEDR